VSQRGVWDEWLEFFLAALTSEARDAAARGEALLEWRARQRRRVGKTRASRTLEAAVDTFLGAPIQTVRSLQSALGVSNRTAQQTMARLTDLGLVEESTGRRRGRVFVIREVVELLEADHL
jgi:Fic family protein